uniref:Caspase n=1 Tax=Strigamia maritima TaxID=126957 RepID=T1J672_STRMM
MEKEQRNKITERLIPLVNSVHDFEDILKQSLDNEIFTEEMISDIKDSRYTEMEQKRNFFVNLTTRGPEAFDKLIQILNQTEHENTADILMSEHAFPDSATLRHRGSGPFTECTASKRLDDIKVKKAIQFNGGELFEKSIYKMTSNPKGLALIIVNKIFDDDVYDRRDGADEDYRLISELFTQLDYKIFPYRDKTKRETEMVIDEFVRNFETHNVDSCVVAISTHGREKGFVCKDNNIFPSEELIQKFNNQNCPILKGKPKMFFIQACRGDQLDAGVPLFVDQADSKAGPKRPIPFPLHDPPHLPSTTDIIVVYSSQFGYVAFNNAIMGSWFFGTLTRVFMDNAYRIELQHLLTEAR